MSLPSFEGVQISKRLVIINSVSTVLDRLVNLALIVWLHQHLVKRVTPEEYSIYPVLMSLMAVMPLIMGVVLGGLGRFVIAAYARKDRRGVVQIVSTMVPVCALVSLAIFVVGLGLAWNVDTIYKISEEYAGEARLMFAILVFNTSLRLGLAPFKLGFTVRQKFVWVHLISFGSNLLRLAVLFALLFGVDTRVLWVAVAALPSTILEQFVMCIISRRLLPELRFDRREIRRELIRPIVSLGGWGMVNRVAVVVRELITMVLLKRYVSPVSVGAYSLGLMVDQRLRSTTVLPLATAGPAMTAMHATGQEERLRRTYFRLGRYLLWTFSFVVVPFLIYRNVLWSLYLGPEFTTYKGAVGVSSYLLSRIFFLFPVPALAMVAVSKGRTRPMGLAALAIESANMIAVFVAIAQLERGAFGVAIALFAVSAVVYPCLHWRLGLSLTGARFVDWARATLVPGTLPALCALPVWAIIHANTLPETWFEAALHLAPGVLVFLLVLALVLDPGEREDLGKIYRRSRHLIGLRTPQRDATPGSG